MDDSFKDPYEDTENVLSNQLKSYETEQSMHEGDFIHFDG